MNSKTRLVPCLFVLMLLFSTALPAQAATVVQTDNISIDTIITIDGAQSLSFTKFDPAVGTLLAASFDLASFVERSNGGPARYWLTIEGDTLAELSLPEEYPETVDGLRKPFNFAGLDGVFGSLSLDDYIGLGALNVIAKTQGSVSPGYPQGTRTGWFGDPGLTLTYTYETSVVPEPAAAWLFASALGVFGYLGKRKVSA